MSKDRTPTIALVVICVLAILAVADGLYLTIVHVDYEIGRPGLNAVCHAFSAKGCSVTAGRFGDLFGVPISVVGMAGASAILVAAVIALVRRRRNDDPARSLVYLLTAFSVLASVVMATLSVIESSFCPFCILWYGLNLGMFLAAWRLRDPYRGFVDVVDDTLGGTGIATLLAFAAGLAFGIWFHAKERAAALDEFEKVKAAIVDKLLATEPVTLKMAHAPSRGPDDADIVIVEFADFECPFCRRVWEMIEEQVEASPHSIRVVFGNFPLDSDCNPYSDKLHPRACAAAIAARCAYRQDRFWEYADLLFANQPEFERDQLLSYADELSLDRTAFEACLDDPATRDAIAKDIAAARLAGVEATPTFFLNGHVHKGGTSPLIFEAMLDRLAERRD
jgi:protein-disulfide isomerase/uncharacterized membrane protein